MSNRKASKSNISAFYDLFDKGFAQDTSIDFVSGNLHNAIHYADVIDIKINFNRSLECKVIDTYDFNPNESNPLVQRGYEYQQSGEIQTYFTVTNILVPFEEWINF